MAIFSKFFGDLITHITREYAGKKIKSFLKNHGYTFVCFYGIQSLNQSRVQTVLILNLMFCHSKMFWKLDSEAKVSNANIVCNETCI
jgi:hypothetical protein